MFSLESEVRNDHLVTEETKKLWFVQMELLKELQRICKKYNIKYYAIEGTLLVLLDITGIYLGMMTLM